MSHIDPGIGSNISMCVQGVGAMCAQKNISNYECNRQTDTHQTQEHSKGYIQLWTKQKIKRKREHK